MAEARGADAALDAALAAGAKALGLPLAPAQRATLLRLLAELADWSERVNLTAIRAPGDMLRKHLLDSLAVARWLRGPRVADVGTGAGFPGLPLAIVLPELSFTLIEATGKKARFVRHAAELLGLANVEVVHARAEAWRPPAPFDTVVARALGSLAEFIGHAGALCARDGRLLAMKGREPADELRELPRGWRALAVHRVEVPGLDAERCVVELARG